MRPYRSILVVGALAAVVGCESAPDVPTPSAEPPTTSAAPPSPADSPPPSTADGGGEVSVFELEVGDCFSTDTDQPETVTVVDCDDEHLYEVFAVLDHPATEDEPYPGGAVLVEYADGACQPPFEEFVGHPYQASIWYITSLSPTDASWADGDREIVCTLNQPDEAGDPTFVTGSAEGAGE